jgi:DNA primase large subunit
MIFQRRLEGRIDSYKQAYSSTLEKTRGALRASNDERKEDDAEDNRDDEDCDDDDDVQDSRFLTLIKQLQCRFRDWVSENVLRPMDLRYTSTNSNANALEMNDTTIDLLAACMPPCVARQHELFRTQHRLKHVGRMIYFSFLRESGMPLWSAIRLVRSEYLRSMSASEFTKGKYEYFLRHIYGLEGRRTPSHTLTCSKITEHYRACPFMTHASAFEVVNADLDSGLINESQHKAVLTAAVDGKSAVACARLCLARRSALDDHQAATAVTDIEDLHVVHPIDFYKVALS